MKSKIILSTLIAFCFITFSACNKSNKAEFEQLDEAQFIQTANGENIRISEDEDFTFSDKLANKLGFKTVLISKGNYLITTSTNDFGTVTLNVKNYELNKASTNFTSDNEKTTLSEDGGLGIRIAKRKKLTCGGEPVSCTCCCGIGFRCGTSSYGGDEEELEMDEFSSTKKTTTQKIRD